GFGPHPDRAQPAPAAWRPTDRAGSVAPAPPAPASWSRRRSSRLCRLQHHLVDVAPQPVLARLERPNDRVAGGVEVSGGVIGLGRVGAGAVAADQALAQVDQAVADLQAVLAAVRARGDVPDLVQVRAGCRGHRPSPLLLYSPVSARIGGCASPRERTGR